MNNSIIGELFLYGENIVKQTIKYLQRIGLDCDEYRKENIDYLKLKNIYFVIEFKEKPFILKTLEYDNCFDEKNYIDILCISEHGISFYIARRSGDGSIFVPMNNINCIHTIEKQIAILKDDF